MASTDRIVIVGGGQAGYQLAASLRQEGHAGTVTIVGDEPGVPYQRPPLSKAYLLGKIGAPQLRFRPPEHFDEQRIARLHDRATRIDRAARQLHLASGGHLSYDHLVLATGARNRVPAVSGVDLDGVFGLRTLADADRLAPRLAAAKQVVVIGAGFIGLEFAAVAAAKGAQVHVLEIADRPMARAVSPAMSALFAAGHAGWGVTMDFGEAAAAIVGSDDAGRAGRVTGVTGVQTAAGRVLPAELVVYGIGVVPNAELAAEAGLTVANGIRVDALLQTDDPAISAIGDVVSYESQWAQQRAVRLESVQNAVDQAKALAARLAGKPQGPYAALPWFWTDQGDLRLQIAGLSDGCDRTVELRNAADSRQLAVLCFTGGRLVAVETCNRTPDHMAARKLLQRATPLAASQAAEPGFDLKAYEAATRDVA